MILMHELQNWAFQFSLALMSKLEGSGALNSAEVFALGEQYYISEHLTDILSALERSGLIRQEKKDSKATVWLAGDLRLPQMPMGDLEKEYLQYILRLPEAELFLTEDTRQALMGEPSSWMEEIRRLRPEGIKDRRPEPEVFRTALEAIRTGKTLRYRFRTRQNAEFEETESIPWKLEYSAYDRRWWIIFFDAEEERTIKAILSNLKDVTLGRPHRVTQDQILDAMEQLKMPDPVVLRVTNERRALERCFLQFETQPFVSTKEISKDIYELAFTYYRFDEEEILRKLMQLGPGVTLISPQNMKNRLRELLLQALEQGREIERHETPVR